MNRAVIAIANHQGVVAKTTTTHGLGRALSLCPNNPQRRRRNAWK
jgi:cellulose biosynthesis protein BcsQ